jgi:hypothetical protein
MKRLIALGAAVSPMPSMRPQRASHPRTHPRLRRIRDQAGDAQKGWYPCSLLTRELIEKVLGGSVNPILLKGRPTEQGIGKSGSSCAYGGVTLQLDFLAPPEFEDMHRKVGKDRVAVPGVGDAAYFRNNQNLFGEVLGRTGSRTFSVLMGIKNASIDVVKSNVIALAKEIVPRLR